MNDLDRLENLSIYILREAYANIRNLCMLWSIGKDSTVLLWLARKAFFNNVPFPLLHIDTTYKIPEMITYRDKLTKEWGLNMVYACNEEAINSKCTFVDKKTDRITCCKNLKTKALKDALKGDGKRYKFNHDLQKYELDESNVPYDGVIVGIRSDEEGSRSKEMYFSSRDRNSRWNLGEQPPEFWGQFNVCTEPDSHIRIHPLLDWTELDIWKYIQRENIPTVSLYYDQGEGTRYRSLGCWPCTFPIQSRAKTISELIQELESGKLANIAERSGRAQDESDSAGLETLRRGGYM